MNIGIRIEYCYEVFILLSNVELARLDKFRNNHLTVGKTEKSRNLPSYLGRQHGKGKTKPLTLRNTMGKII